MGVFVSGEIVILAAAVAAEAIVRFVAVGEMESFTITLGDLAVRRLTS